MTPPLVCSHACALSLDGRGEGREAIAEQHLQALPLQVVAVGVAAPGAIRYRLLALRPACSSRESCAASTGSATASPSMNDGKPLRHADDRIIAPRMLPKKLFRWAKAANWLVIRLNRLIGGRSHRWIASRSSLSQTQPTGRFHMGNLG